MNIFKIISNRYFGSFLFSYFWCQAFNWCSRPRKQARILYFRTESGSRSRAYRGRLRSKYKNINECFYYIKYLVIEFFKFPLFELQSLGSGSETLGVQSGPYITVILYCICLSEHETCAYPDAVQICGNIFNAQQVSLSKQQKCIPI